MTRPLLLVVAVTMLGAWSTVGHAQAGRRGEVLDANTASERQLQGMPGITAELSRAILQRRPFASVLDFDTLLATSLSPSQRAETYKRQFVQVNLNTASDAEILLIPNLGSRVLDELKASRPYRALAQFRRELGKSVTEQELTELEQYVFVPLNLNTASDADILTIPGLGNRMLGEFKEYRPYRSMAQFRREIGKYVNDKEVARLERYVTLD